MKNKLVSIAMATYNGETYLHEQINSILNQTYSNLEIIICDDCSIDATRPILEGYALKDQRIKLFFNKTNLGLVKNFEKAISLCTGDYIALADQDDIWLPEKIEILVKNIGNHLLIHSDAFLIDDKGNTFATSYSQYSNKNFKKNLKAYIVGNNVTGCTALFDERLLEYALPFPSGTMAHDWWLALCAYKFGTIQYLDLPLIKYRQHEYNQIGATVSGTINPFEFRVKNFKKKFFFLKGVYDSNMFSNEEKKFIHNLIEYYDDFFNKTIRLKSFLFHLRNFKYFRQEDPFVYKIAGLVLSILGQKIQKRLWEVIT